MNAQELTEFMAARKPTRHSRFDTGPRETLPCQGCAHSASGAAFPGFPSGERPCMSCVRNPSLEQDRFEHAKRHENTEDLNILIGDDGHARVFDAFAGTMYNGAPRVYFPMDNYVTLDQRDQEDWLRDHPEYAKPVRVGRDGTVKVMEDD